MVPDGMYIMSSIITWYFSTEFYCLFRHHHNLRKHRTDAFLNVFKMENITLGANISETITPDSKMDNSTIAVNALRIFYGFTAMCGNSLIITCVFKYRVLRNPTNSVIANLSAAVIIRSSPTRGNFFFKKFPFLPTLPLLATSH